MSTRTCGILHQSYEVEQMPAEVRDHCCWKIDLETSCDVVCMSVVSRILVMALRTPCLGRRLEDSDVEVLGKVVAGCTRRVTW